MLFTDPNIQAWKKYSFGYNFDIDKARTKRITWYYPFNQNTGRKGIDPETEVVNGVSYANFIYPLLTFVTIARRGDAGGGYYCIDLPLAAFTQSPKDGAGLTAKGSNVGHYRFELNDWEIDLTNSYVRFSQPIGNVGNFMLNFFFDLQPQ